jgi:tRNA-2-methylthio-N6-dimethylallyladenosine synthase
LKVSFWKKKKLWILLWGLMPTKTSNLLAEVEEGRDAINVILSKDETYGDISPVRLMSNGITALVSITRGCDICVLLCSPFHPRTTQS